MLSSCDDYLQLEPKDSLIQQEFWQTKEHVSAAVAGCYASMNQSAFTDRLLKWGELRAEMLVSLRAGNNERNMLKNFILPSNSITDWGAFYKVINHCNLVLEFTDQAQQNDLSFTIEEANTFKAEAKAIRSLVYFILVRNFKELPLITTATSTTEVDFFPPNSTEQQIIDQIIFDLVGDENNDGAIEHLELNYLESTAHDKGRMTKAAAYTLLSDVYLWNSQYDKCIEACNEVQNTIKYSLEDGIDWFNNIFLFGNSSKESIFELQFDNLVNSTLNNAYNNSNPTYAAYSGIRPLFSEFPDDVRARFSTFGTENQIFKFAGVDEVPTYRAQAEFFNNHIFYRYADVLLIKAEAYILSETQQDLTEANRLIDLVHFRATGVPLDVNLDEQSLLEALLLERQKEFAYEGKRWYDLLRFDRRDNFENELILELVFIKAGNDDFEQIFSSYSDPEGYFLPINQTELNLNPNLVQNPYYEN